ncbi:hypothetical protein J3Q64DRAFT_1774974 [Phycomyces blakesleeanus]|uniref:AMP-dependent synthetase/ligase domain-containing protein n=1 Tax=Phycomyces blakesleeanus TaxID=4837 RepID=A0ABR3ALF3_PHYBL
MSIKSFSIEVAPAAPGESATRRSILSPSELMVTPALGVETLHDILQYSATHYRDRDGFGYRVLEDTIVEEKDVTKTVNGVEKTETKIWTYLQLSKYSYFTYGEALEIAKALGSGLSKIGMQKQDKLQISASTSVEWMMMAHAAFSQTITIVTAYDTLGAEGLQHAMNEAESATCFINGDQFPIIEQILPSCPTVKNIIYRGKVKQEDIKRIQKSGQIQYALSYEELLSLGQQNQLPPVKPKSEDICCIMYTSGSTGNPKGVVLSHKNVVAAVAGCCRMLQHLVEEGDRVLAYLPLAHVLEFLVESLCIFFGVTLGYGSIRTLTEVSVRNCRGDIQEFAPTILTGVPQVWETIRKSILTKVVQKGPRIEKIFHGALDLKDYMSGYGLPTGFLDKVVFNNVKKQLGGKLRYGLSGGAPLSAETQRFLSMSACPLLGGYGMTESCGMCAVMSPDQFAYGEVGAPVPCVEVKFVDVPEAGYLSTNLPRPQGEIWIRGPSITSGYFKQENTTRETLTPDGWLMTGDIGEWTDRGTLCIIDRKKNLVKMSNGEYIALEKLESVYKTSVIVENMCVCADSLYAKPIALVVPAEGALRALALKSGGIQIESWDELCENKDVRKLVHEVLLQQGKKGGLKGAELLFDIWVCKELWTPESGYLTPAQKLKRKEILTYYSKQLKEINTRQII